VKYRNAVYNNGSITDELWIHKNKNKSEQEIVRVCTALQAMSQCHELFNEVSVFIACIHITDSDIRIRDTAYTALMKACKHKSECFTPDSIIIITASLLHVYDDSREYAAVILGELSKYRPSVITFDIYKQLYKQTSDPILSVAASALLTIESVKKHCTHLQHDIESWHPSNKTLMN
jgi:hypothetical protein